MLTKIVTALIALMWPISLFVANTGSDFLQYITPSALVALGLYLWFGNSKHKYLPFAAIPLVEPKLLLLPVLLVLVVLVKSRDKSTLVFLGLTIGIAIFSWNGFKGQTIFTQDHEAKQLVIRNQQLYPSPLTARLFHNKARIILEKFAENFFAIIDPGNYFFGFAPRQIGVVNQNLDKFPFLSLPFFLFGLYHFKTIKKKSFLVLYLAVAILSLSFLTLFDKQDFVLWSAITLICIHGLREFEKRLPKVAMYFLPIFLVFTVIEYVRIFIRWT